jgi:hypothetical protein
MRNRVGILLLVVVFLPTFPPILAEEDSPPIIVVHAEGAVERLLEAGETELLEIGHDAVYADRIALGQGAVLSIVRVEGSDAGRVLKLRGPAEGTLRELIEAAAGEMTSGALEDRLLDSFRTPPPDELTGPGITRAAEKGPLRPVYPAGRVAAPLGTFVFVAGIDDLEGGHLELRVFDRKPDAGAEPIVAKRVEKCLPAGRLRQPGGPRVLAPAPSPCVSEGEALPGCLLRVRDPHRGRRR